MGWSVGMGVLMGWEFEFLNTEYWGGGGWGVGGVILLFKYYGDVSGSCFPHWGGGGWGGRSLFSYAAFRHHYSQSLFLNS